MREQTVLLKMYDSANTDMARIDMAEIKRYAGMAGNYNGIVQDLPIENVISECLNEVLPVLDYKVSYLFSQIEWLDGDAKIKKMKLPFDTFDSKNLQTNLEDCEEIIMFAATIGIGIDRLIAKYNHISPVKALFMQAIGAERIETLCNVFCKEMENECKERGLFTRPRYSPGYGDLPLEVQKEFVALLDCSRRIGVNLNESLLMSPSKSVTAIVGLSKECKTGNTHNCKECTLSECAYRIQE